jgi:hypothetical protein
LLLTFPRSTQRVRDSRISFIVLPWNGEKVWWIAADRSVSRHVAQLKYTRLIEETQALTSDFVANYPSVYM